jgi:hypothetical protein
MVMKSLAASKTPDTSLDFLAQWNVYPFQLQRAQHPPRGNLYYSTGSSLLHLRHKPAATCCRRTIQKQSRVEPAVSFWRTAEAAV